MRRFVNFPAFFLCCVLLSSTLTSCNPYGSRDDDGLRLEDLPGKIIYSSQQGSENHIFLTDAKGTRKLTSAEGITDRNYYASHCSFSPDGEWIIYISNRGTNVGDNAIYKMRPDGSDRSPVTDENGKLLLGEAPAISPDGMQVAFNRPEYADSNHDIYITDLADGKIRRLTTNTADDKFPAWSPDGSNILFATDRDYVDAEEYRYRNDIYMVNIDGSGVERQTNEGFIGTGNHQWISSESFVYYTYSLHRPSKDVFEKNTVTDTQNPIIKDLQVRSLWLFWDSTNQQLLTVNKKYQELPVTFSIFDSNGNLLKQKELSDPVLKNATSFNWRITDEENN